VPAFFDYLLQPALDFTEGRCKRCAARVDDDIPRCEFGAVMAERFTDAPFDSIPDDGAAERARHGESDTRSGNIFPLQAKRREDWTGDADAVVIDDAKVRGFEDPGSSRKRQAIWQTGRLFRR